MAGTITALEVQKRDKQRVNVFLDEQYSFSLPLIHAVHLKRGQRLSDQEIDALRAEDLGERAYESALKLLEYRPRSEAEVRRSLQRKGLPEVVVEQTLERLRRAKLVDDHDFAQFWVENRQRFRPRGLAALRYELKAKGLDEGDITTALGDVDEGESAYSLARAQARRKSQLAPQELRRHLGQYLARRGFQYSVIADIVRQVVAEAGSIEDGEPTSSE